MDYEVSMENREEANKAEGRKINEIGCYCEGEDRCWTGPIRRIVTEGMMGRRLI